ncbi:MAG: 4-hydroxythreonine-4-phosphate dehydrogenase PdxA [Syntrophobacteraceae bacterium]
MNKDDPFRPRIAITMGDPCGIGPEILVKALAGSSYDSIVIGDPLALRRANDLIGAGLNIEVPDGPKKLDREHRPGAIRVICPQELSSDDISFGRPSKRCCKAVILYIETAVRLALAGNVDAICTCPIHKANLHQSGFAFPGHTEFLRELTGAAKVVMMLAGPMLRVALATIHEAIANVPGLLSRERLTSTIQITGESLLRDFGIPSPRVAVAGLNPHAGEDGKFGREEIEVIRPVIQGFHGYPYTVSGPYPPDTIFYRAYQGEFDAVVAMYHDQGLGPLKLVHFKDGVNISLGLPIIRTSVDHGTAYELAGTGRAHEGSLLAAIELAAFMARNRARLTNN